MTLEEARSAIRSGEVYSASTVDGVHFTPHSSEEDEHSFWMWLSNDFTPTFFG